MMTAPSLLPAEGKSAGDGPPRTSLNSRGLPIPGSPDFSSLIGMAQAGTAPSTTNQTNRANKPKTASPDKDGEDDSSANDPNIQPPAHAPKTDAADAAVASLLLALLTPPAAPPPNLPNLAPRGETKLQSPVEPLSAEPAKTDAANIKPDPARGENVPSLALSKPAGDKPPTLPLPTTPAPPNPPSPDASPTLGAGDSTAASPQKDRAAFAAAEMAAPKVVPSAGGPLGPTSGTAVAPKEQRMKFAAQKNEIAGYATQKLPPGQETALSGATADDAGPATKIRLPIDFPPSKDSSSDWTLVNIAAQTGANSAPADKTSNSIAPPPIQLDVVDRAISREVLMVRQSGADALAVSLKVDAHTSLFLQLTNHNGQIEAAVRCEKGDAAQLDSHWGQLQESLARQNVHLLPLEDVPKPVPGAPPPGAAASKDFTDRQSSQNHQPPPQTEPEMPPDDAINAAIAVAKSKHKNHPRHAFEKWA